MSWLKVIEGHEEIPDKSLEEQAWISGHMTCERGLTLSFCLEEEEADMASLALSCALEAAKHGAFLALSLLINEPKLPSLLITLSRQHCLGWCVNYLSVRVTKHLFHKPSSFSKQLFNSKVIIHGNPTIWGDSAVFPDVKEPQRTPFQGLPLSLCLYYLFCDPNGMSESVHLKSSDVI